MLKFSQLLVDEIFEMDKDKSPTTREIAQSFDLKKTQVDYILYKRSPSVKPNVVIKKELAKVRKFQESKKPDLNDKVKVAKIVKVKVKQVKKKPAKVKKTPVKVVEEKKPKTVFESLMDFFT